MVDAPLFKTDRSRGSWGPTIHEFLSSFPRKRESRVCSRHAGHGRVAPVRIVIKSRTLRGGPGITTDGLLNRFSDSDLSTAPLRGLFGARRLIAP